MVSKSPPDGTNQGKGKGKDTQDALQASSSNKQDSMLSRIANSTTSLANSMLSGAPSNSTLAHSISGEKGSSSTAGISAVKQGESSTPIQQDKIRGSSFRPSQAHTHAAAEEAAFADFLDSADELTTPGENDLQTAWQYHLATPSKLSAGFTSVAEAQQHDGEDVINLLMQDGEQFEPPEEETLSPEDMETLRRALFGNSSGRGQMDSLTDPMNFIPAHLRHPETEHYVQLYMTKKDKERASGVVVPDGSEIMRDEMEIGSDVQNEEAQQTFAWLEQWDDVLTSYMDEVWGDFGGLLREARKELQELERVEESREQPPDTKALRRLRAILGHLRGH